MTWWVLYGTRNRNQGREHESSAFRTRVNWYAPEYQEANGKSSAKYTSNEEPWDFWRDELSNLLLCKTNICSLTIARISIRTWSKL